MKTMRWTHCVAAAGASLLLGCMGSQYLTVPFAPMANATVAAVALLVFATLALVLRLEWSGWATLPIAAWLAAASSLLRAEQTLMPLLLVGVTGLILCLGLLATALPRQRRRH